MKNTLKTVIIAVAIHILDGGTPSLLAAEPAPLIAAPKAAAARTETDKQAEAARRIDAQLAGLQSSIKFAVGSIQREIAKNRDGLTPEQVRAALGAEKAASLAQAQADLVTLVNKYAPGSFPEEKAKK